MNKTEHKIRHKELHEALDELLADYLLATKNNMQELTVMDLLEWSFRQTIKPDHEAPDV